MAKAKSGVGKFLLGWLFGIIFTLGAVGGLGFWIYKNMTIHSVENLTGAEIGIMEEEAKDKTIEELVNVIINVSSSSGTMTIEEASDELGIRLSSFFEVVGEGVNRIYKYQGLDVSAIVKGRFGDIAQNAQTVVNSLTLQNIVDVFGITLPNISLINNDEVLNAQLKDLGVAFNNSVSNYTLRKLADDFDIPALKESDLLSSMLDATIEELPSKLDKLKVGDLFVKNNITLDKTYTYTVSENSVTTFDQDNKIITIFDKTSDTTFNVIVNNGTTDIAQLDFVIASGELSVKYTDLAKGTKPQEIVVYKDDFDLTSFATKDSDTNSNIVKNLYDIVITELGNQISAEIENTLIRDIVTIEEGSMLDKIIGEDTTVGNLSSAINNVTIGTLFPDETDGVLYALRDCTIANLSTEIEELTLADMIPNFDNSNSLLQALGDATVYTLNEKINALTFNDLFPDKTEESYHPIILKLKEKNIKLFDLENNVGDIINKLTLKDVLTDANFSTGMLSLLSVERGGELVTGGDIHIGEMTTAINNMSETLKTKTLFELKELGIITTEDKTLNENYGTTGTKIGDFTIDGLISAIASVGA